MLEDIREGLMERLHKKRDYIFNKDIGICPRLQARLEKSKVGARGWSAYWDGHFCYGVREGATQTRYVVSLLDRTCSCNSWQLSGVPCNHVVTAIWKAHELPEHYVSNFFSKETYLKAYQFPLEPLNGPQQWPQSPYVPIIAPQVKKICNRPTTKRKPSLGEVAGTKLSKKGCINKCSNCGASGHNKRKCTAPTKQPQPRKPTKQAKFKSGSKKTQCERSVPIHNRGVGVYTHPNGYQRQARLLNNNGTQSNSASSSRISSQLSSLYNGPTQLL